MTATALIEALGLAAARVVAVVGAGGKTSLTLALARTCAERGERVLVTTTTKMGLDQIPSDWPLTVGADAVDAPACGGAPLCAFAKRDERAGKWIGLEPQVVHRLAGDGHFDRILVEADGARHRPLKAAADHEPVIPASVDLVIAVAGLSALGQPLGEETVFRSGRWAELTGKRVGELLTTDDLARMASHPDGLGKGIPADIRWALFLNQADDATTVGQGDRVLQQLPALGGRLPERGIVGRLLPRPQIAVVR